MLNVNVSFSLGAFLFQNRICLEGWTSLNLLQEFNKEVNSNLAGRNLPTINCRFVKNKKSAT